jgi:hypothetical protein
MRNFAKLFPFVLMLAACTPAAQAPPPVAGPAPPVQSPPETSPAATLTPAAAAATDSTAVAGMPSPGSYGFNWLDPESSCKQLGEPELAKLSTCTASENAFGLELESLACRVDEHVELIVYKTAAQCQQALETMQANGP